MSQRCGICNKCGKRVPASHEEQGDRVLLVKDCPDCGRTETIVSVDVEAYKRKRDLDRISNEAGCNLKCTQCSKSHRVTTVFLEVTNRCNQNCPICIANIPHMGFRFEPPFEYFQRIFEHLAKQEPKPSIKLFGGEPTVREDLFDIVKCARDLGLSTSIVTNGLRFADEEYAKKLLATKAKLIFAFDGRSPDVYRVLRGDESCYEKKLKAIENIRKHRRSKMTIMCVVGRGLNDHLIGDLIEFCHERRDCINALEFIPLTRVWEEGSIEADGKEITAMEDVERIIADAVPGKELEFLPAGLSPYDNMAKYLPLPRLTFAGAHPNCESISFLFSNGQEYVPAANYFKGRSLYGVAQSIIDLDTRFGQKMQRIENGFLGRIGLARTAGRGLAVVTNWRALRRNLDMKAIFGKHSNWKLMKVALGLVMGRKTKNVLRANSELQNVIRLVVLPFEEPRTLDSARLERCPAAFAYMDPADEQVKMIPVCAWGLYRDDLFRGIMRSYGLSA